jgi:membrane protein YdbS with pleckstrin-like domain
VPDLPTRPHPSLRGVWFWRGLGLGLVLSPALGWPLLLPLGAALRLAGLSYAAAYGGGAVLLFAAYVVGLWVWTRLAYRRFRFELLPDEIRIHKGVAVRTVTRIPLARVRRVSVRRGPLLRRLGLGTVRLEVFGRLDATPHPSDGQLPGLREADEVAAWIAARLGASQTKPATASVSVPRRTRPSG